MNRRRILIVTTGYLPLIGGSEIAISEITRRLPEFDFDIITGMPTENLPRYEKSENREIYRVGSAVHRASIFLPKALLPIVVCKKILKLNRAHRYDVIHCYQASAAAGGAFLAKLFLPKTPLLLTLQEGEQLEQQPWLKRIFRKLILSRVNRVTAISSYLAGYIKKVNSTLWADIIPNGIDVLKFSAASEKRKEVRDNWGMADEDMVVMTVSRLVPKNGVENLIRAFALVPSEPILMIVGTGYLEHGLQKLAESLGVSKRIKWLGQVLPKEIPEYLSGADIFVRSSVSEGLGNAFLEAMAAGVPVVAPMIGGIPDFLTDNENGLACDPKNPADISSKITTLVRNEDLRHKLSANGRKTVSGKYEWSNIAASMADVYNQLINR